METFFSEFGLLLAIGAIALWLTLFLGWVVGVVPGRYLRFRFGDKDGEILVGVGGVVVLAFFAGSFSDSASNEMFDSLYEKENRLNPLITNNEHYYKFTPLGTEVISTQLFSDSLSSEAKALYKNRYDPLRNVLYVDSQQAKVIFSNLYYRAKHKVMSHKTVMSETLSEYRRRSDFLRNTTFLFSLSSLIVLFALFFVIFIKPIFVHKKLPKGLMRFFAEQPIKLGLITLGSVSLSLLITAAPAAFSLFLFLDAENEYNQRVYGYAASISTGSGELGEYCDDSAIEKSVFNNNCIIGYPQYVPGKSLQSLSAVTKISNDHYLAFDDSKAQDTTNIYLFKIGPSDKLQFVRVYVGDFPSSDLEASCYDLDGRLYVSESGYYDPGLKPVREGKMYVINIGRDRENLKDGIKAEHIVTLPRIDSDIEGLACRKEGGLTKLYFGHRGYVHEESDLYPNSVQRILEVAGLWGTDKTRALFSQSGKGSILKRTFSKGKMERQCGQVDIDARQLGGVPSGSVRAISGMSFGENGSLYISQALDAGDYGPFRSAIYRLDDIEKRFSCGQTMSDRTLTLHKVGEHFKGKIEGVAFSGNKVTYVTDNEAFPSEAGVFSIANE